MPKKGFIDKTSNLPYYEQLKNILLNSIKKEKFPNRRFYSEHELSRKYDITVTTVRRTLAELEREGLIYKVKGLGTFIKKPKLDIDFTKYLYLGRALKKIGAKEDIKVLKCEVVDYKEIYFQGHKVNNPSKKILSLERIRIINDEPLVFERIFFNYNICNKIINNKEVKSVYDFIIKNLKLKISKDEEYLEPINLGSVESKILKVDEGSAVLLIVKHLYTYPQTWVESVYSYVRGDRCRYHVSV